MIFDILFLIFVAAGFWWGYRNGIIYSLFSIVGLFVGVLAALKFSYKLVIMLHGWIHMGPQAMAITAFILIIVLVLLIFKLVAWGLEQILKSFSLNITNKIIGGVIYSLMSLYILCVLIWFLNKLDVFPQKQKDTSHVYSYINNVGPRVVEITGKVIPFFRDAFKDFDTLFESKTPD